MGRSSMPETAEETYDFIVTGAGSAGCVVAARLSESGRHRVLLLEAGPPDSNPWIHIPLGFAKTYVNPAVNWRFETEPQPQLGGRKLYLPRGKTLGGSSSINGMVYIRGSHGDYDEWRQRGCENWDWDSVLPFFKKAENQTHGANEFHGVGGPLHVSDQPEGLELADAVLEACVQAGIPRNPDFNGAQSGRLRLLPDHQQQQAALEHGESLSGTRTRTPQSRCADRRACDARADREQPRGRRRVPYRAGPPHRACPRRDHCFGWRVRLATVAAAVRSWPRAALAGRGRSGRARHAGGWIQPARSLQLLSQLAVQQADHA